MKKLNLLLLFAGCVCLFAFAFSGCGDVAKNEAPAKDAAAVQKVEEDAKPSDEEKNTESVELVDGMYIYTNEEFKFSMAFPGDWNAPKGEVDDVGDLNVDVSSKDETEYIFVTMGEIDPEAPTPEDFEKQLTSVMEAELGELKQESGKMTINGVDFIKSKLDIESKGIIQVTYIAYTDEMYCAITVMQSADKWANSQPTIEKIENSIKIQQ